MEVKWYRPLSSKIIVRYDVLYLAVDKVNRESSVWSHQSLLNAHQLLYSITCATNKPHTVALDVLTFANLEWLYH